MAHMICNELISSYISATYWKLIYRFWYNLYLMKRNVIYNIICFIYTVRRQYNTVDPIEPKIRFILDIPVTNAWIWPIWGGLVHIQSRFYSNYIRFNLVFPSIFVHWWHLCNKEQFTLLSNKPFILQIYLIWSHIYGL